MIRKTLGDYRSLAALKERHPDVELYLPGKFFCDDFAGLQMGRGVSIGRYSEIIIMYRSKESKIAGELSIGDRAVIGSFCNIRACGGKIQIGRNALIAQNVSMVAANHTMAPNAIYRDLPWEEDRTGIVIGDNAWIGAGVVILPGVTIGENSVIAAGAVVTRNVPKNEVWAGLPAKKLRDV